MIEITGKYTTCNGTDVIELTTVGTYSHVDGKYYMTYREQSENMGNVITTMVSEGNGKVILSRSGDITSRLLLESGKRHTCSYDVNGMQLIMGVFSEKVITELNEKSGHIYLSYTLDINSDLISKNEIEIKINQED